MSKEEKIGLRILIVLFGAIGDVVRGLPVATRIRRVLPDAHITWAIEPAACDLVSSHPAVDRVLLFERSQGFFGYMAFVRQMREQHYDVCLDLQRHFKSGVTSWLSRSARRIGFHRLGGRECNWLFQTETIGPVEKLSDKTEHFQMIADMLLGVSTRQSPLDFGLTPTAESQNRIRDLVSQRGNNVEAGSKRIAMVLGASWKSKQWSTQRFQELTRRILQMPGTVCFLVGGPGDQKLAEEVVKELADNRVIDCTAKISLADLPALFGHVDVVVSGDSGPMHIAAAAGKPVIGLYGSTSPARSSAYANEHLVLQSSIACVPCYLRNCPGLGNLCMWDISAETVFSKIQTVLAQ